MLNRPCFWSLLPIADSSLRFFCKWSILWFDLHFILVADDRTVCSQKRKEIKYNNVWFWHSLWNRWQLYGLYDMRWWNLYFYNNQHLSKMSFTINTFTHLLCACPASLLQQWIIWAHICRLKKKRIHISKFKGNAVWQVWQVKENIPFIKN